MLIACCAILPSRTLMVRPFRNPGATRSRYAFCAGRFFTCAADKENSHFHQSVMRGKESALAADALRIIAARRQMIAGRHVMPFDDRSSPSKRAMRGRPGQWIIPGDGAGRVGVLPAFRHWRSPAFRERACRSTAKPLQQKAESMRRPGQLPARAQWRPPYTPLCGPGYRYSARAAPPACRLCSARRACGGQRQTPPAILTETVRRVAGCRARPRAAIPVGCAASSDSRPARSARDRAA